MRDTIIALAGAICSPTPAERPVLEALCAAAEKELMARLREDSSAGGQEALPCAAALLAAAGLWECRAGEGTESFTVGQVSLRREGGSSCAPAAALRRQAERLMAPWSCDDRFAFLEVRG